MQIIIPTALRIIKNSNRGESNAWGANKKTKEDPTKKIGLVEVQLKEHNITLEENSMYMCSTICESCYPRLGGLACKSWFNMKQDHFLTYFSQDI